MNIRHFSIKYTLLFLLPIISFGQSQKLVRQGKRLSDPNEKIATFEKAIALDNQNLDAYFYRGLARYSLEDYLGAVVDFTKIIFIKPDPDSFYNRGNAKFALGDYDGAYEDYKMAIAHKHDFFQAHYNLGVTQFNLGRYKEALYSFNFLYGYFPTDVNTNIQMGLTLKEMKHYDLALIFLNKSIDLEPNSDTYHNRGVAYLSMRAYNKAAEDFKTAISFENTNDSAYFYLGLTQLYNRNFTEAAKNFENTLSFNALDHEALVALAIANYHIDNYNDAKSHFKKAKSILSPQNEYHPYISDIALFNDNLSSLSEGANAVFQTYFDRLNAL